MPQPDHSPSDVNLDRDGLPVPDPSFREKHKANVMRYLSGETNTEPVLHATDPGAFRDLSARIPGLLVTSAGGAFPFQSEGTLHGYPYYFRYRHGHAELQVHEHGTTPMSSARLYETSLAYGDEHGGTLDRDEFLFLMIAMVPMLCRARWLWEFAGVRVNIHDTDPEGEQVNLVFTATDTREVYRAWGYTPEEAWMRLHEPSPYLLERGWSAETQAEMYRLRAIAPTPLNSDTRNFPDPEPTFEVQA